MKKKKPLIKIDKAKSHTVLTSFGKSTEGRSVSMPRKKKL